MKTILFLEGGPCLDHPESARVLTDMGFEVSTMLNLHSDPGQLMALPKLNPDCLFIFTTGMRVDENQSLIDIFERLAWVPKNVMFFNDNSAMLFRSVASRLREMGTRFWESPIKARDEELFEIDWL